jgi:hypothetical protein
MVVGMDSGWISALVAGIASLAGALGSGYIGARSALRRDIEQKRRTAAQEAANEIVEEIHALRAVVKRSRSVDVQPTEISEATARFQRAWERQSHRLPEGWPNFSRELMLALGTHFGAVGWSHVFPENAGKPLAEFDPVWWQNADEYVQHLGYWTARWGDYPDRGKQAPLGFDAWLTRRRTLEEGPAPSLPTRLFQRVLGG